MTSPAVLRGTTMLAALLLGVLSVPALSDAAGDAPATGRMSSVAGDQEDGPSAPDGAGAAVVGTTPSTSPVTDVEVPDDPILPRHLEGGRVLATAPDRVPEIARRSGVDTAAMVELLRDDTVWVSPRGRAYVRERQPVAAGAAAGQAQETAPETAPTADRAATQADQPGALGSTPALLRRYPASQTFALQSRPGAARTIYIDADGAAVAGTAWNDKLPDGTWAGFNEQGGSAAETSDYEHAWVQEVWRQVAEAYAPFDVNVTTLDAGGDAWQRRTSSDASWGSRVVLTTSAQPREVLCGGCLGVAWIGSFGSVDRNASYQPAWVFASPTMTPTIAAQAVSHEVGHNLGLGHDGGSSSEYTFGTGQWGPIMGGATHRAVSQWSRGEYAGASNTQDDLAVIAAHQLPLRPDDHGDAPSSATGLGTAAAYDVEGVVGTPTDVDVVSVVLPCRTTLDARAQGVGAQTTLDVALTLRGPDGSPLTTSAPAAGTSSRAEQPSGVRRSTGMDAALQRTLEAGTYYLEVDGVGHGTAAQVADMTGWTGYGSLGHYRLTASAPGCAPTPSPSPTVSPTGSPTSEPSATPSSSPSTGPSTGPSASPSASPSSSPSAGPTPTSPPSSTPPVPDGPVTAPGAPRIATATSGQRGGQSTATVRWRRPTTDGGSDVTGHRVAAYRLDAKGRVVRTLRTALVPGQASAVQVLLPRGRYRFAVQAVNEAGSSSLSSRSNLVLAR